MSEPTCKIVADSITPRGDRLTTFEVCFWRPVLAEWNTHRMFCLAGDAVLEFDLPTPKGNHRVYKMTIAEFVDKWHNGAAPRRNKGGRGFNRQPIRDRLGRMQIRQLDENTGLISHSTVVDCTVSGHKEVFEVRTQRHAVAGSADHLILTANGYMRIGDLEPGDEIVVQKRSKKPEDVMDPMRLKKIGGRWRSVWQRDIRRQREAEIGACENCEGFGPFDIHHIVSVHVDPSLAFDEDNVEMLCKDCHKQRHAKQGWQGGTYLLGATEVITEIVPRGVEGTYDLWIDGDFANFVANGVVVHNSRNSASSRAIPLHKQIQKIMDGGPAAPIIWASEQRGMQGGDEVPMHVAADASQRWDEAAQAAVKAAEHLGELGIHKSIANRLLEPFMMHTAVITATGFGNFFDQRCSPLAQPEIRAVAELMQDEYIKNEPRLLSTGQWHLPYIDEEDWEALRKKTVEDIRDLGKSMDPDMVKISAARCAQLSYLTQPEVDPETGQIIDPGGKRDIEKDLARYYKLTSANPKHWSPLEHVATPMQHNRQEGVIHLPSIDGKQYHVVDLGYRPKHGNLLGWASLRSIVEAELGEETYR